MRLLIQGCLILLLGLLAGLANAADAVVSQTLSGSGDPYQCPASSSDQCHTEAYTRPTDTIGGTGQYWVVFFCSGDMYKGAVNTRTETVYGEEYQHPDTMDCWYEPPAQCVSPSYIDPDTGDCNAPVEPEACYEQGQIYDAEYGRCVLDCPNGQLNGVCLQDVSSNADQCDSSSDDYLGHIGNGNTKYNLCSSNMQCDGGAFGLVNGIPACIPDEYGPPTCPADGALVIDEYGFVCDSVNDVPEPTEQPKDPNTDTDGDGEPDEYRRENDPNSTDDAVDGVASAVESSNNKLDGVNNRLDRVGKGVDKLDQTIRSEGSQTQGILQEIRDGQKAPDGGFNPDGFGGLVPTFEETIAGFKSAVDQMPQVVALVEFTDIGTNTSCPVYTLPETPVSGPIVMDIHCDVFEDYRGVLSGLFLFFWVGIALFIFFKA